MANKTYSIEVHNDGCAIGFYPLTEHASKQVGCPIGDVVWMEPKEARIYLRHLKRDKWSIKFS